MPSKCLTELVATSDGTTIGRLSSCQVRALCHALGCVSVQQIEDSLRQSSKDLSLHLQTPRDVAEDVMLIIYPQLVAWLVGETDE